VHRSVCPIKQNMKVRKSQDCRGHEFDRVPSYLLKRCSMWRRNGARH
jgi:hypothetical protein